MPEASNSTVHGYIHGKPVTYSPTTPEALKKKNSMKEGWMFFNPNLINRNTIKINQFISIDLSR